MTRDVGRGAVNQAEGDRPPRAASNAEVEPLPVGRVRVRLDLKRNLPGIQLDKSGPVAAFETGIED
jgi:hypothetical protein